MQTSSLILLYAFAVAASGPEGGQWPMFRGPNGSGVGATAKPPARFGPSEGVAWKTAVPGSPSSPCVWGDRIFLTTFAEGKLETRAYSVTDGKLVWSRISPAETVEEFLVNEGSPAASTPATDGAVVVSYFGSCGLAAYDFDGKELWRYPLPVAQTFGGYGSGTSPLIADGAVVLVRDQVANSSVLALDLKTGKKRWETPRPEAITGWGTPIFWRNDGQEEVVVPGNLFVKSYALKTGELRWSFGGVTHTACTTPVIGEDLLFFAAWAPGKSDSPLPTWTPFASQYDKDKDGVITVEEMEASMRPFMKAIDLNKDGRLTKEDFDELQAQIAKGQNVAVAIKSGGRGDITRTHSAWQVTRGLPYLASPLYYEGRVYFVKDGGMVSCINAQTGEPVYLQERLPAARSYYASPIAADGRILFASLEGRVTVIKAGGDKPEVLHQANFAERIAATPALVKNRIYLRTATSLYAFE